MANAALTKAAQDLLKNLSNLIQCCISTKEAMLSDSAWEAQLMQTEELAHKAREQLLILEQTAGFPENLTSEARSQLRDLLSLWNAELDSLYDAAKNLFNRTETSIEEEF